MFRLKKQALAGVLIRFLLGCSLLSAAGPEPADRPLRRIREDPPARFNPARAEAGEVPAGLSIPGLDNALTRQYIRQYSGAGGLAWLKAVMDRGGPYQAFIRQEIEKRNLPPELIYLPVIESAYLPTAVSKSGAVGLWQFMKNSIGPFDMRVTTWMDERMDFRKSTEGALRKLEENYRYFGDWPLALAAYNAGLGAISRIVRQTGIRDYWVLSANKQLRTETVHYVPKLLAVSYILSNSRRFGLDLSWAEDPQWTRIPVDRQVDLDLLAEQAGINGEALKQGNRELLFSVTPPEAGYELKVRAADAGAIAAVLEQRDIPLINYYFYTIQSGDTLSVLARHYGISVEQILAVNPGTEPRFLRPGARLRIPAIKEVSPYQRERTGGEDRAPVFEGNHLVKRGETLWSIALAYDVDPEFLAEANGMDLNDILREGRSLKTPIRKE
ncbi:MAG: transglycosylase SLT domain-containing protein [Treponema sp.]|nr:transglycosylase SLT domain-containing protein [Treponema sp.]